MIIVTLSAIGYILGGGHTCSSQYSWTGPFISKAEHFVAMATPARMCVVRV